MTLARVRSGSGPSPDGPIRVLHVVSLLGHGGMEAGVMKLVTGCDPSRVVADVCTLEPARAFQDQFSDESRLHELRRGSAFDIGMIRALSRIVRERRIDVVHTHQWGTLVEGWLAARMAKAPHFVHGEHGTMETRRANVAVQRRIWKRADRLLAVSAELAHRMCEHTGISTEHIKVITNGVDLGLYDRTPRDEARAGLGLDPGALLTVSIGRLVPVKNYELLIAAARIVRDAGGSWQFLVAGDGPLRSDLELRIASEGLTGTVRLLGHQRDVAALLAAADAFVLTSWSEGMSNTILEAMAAGRPVIATRVGGNAELVLDRMTGMLVRPEVPRDIADALLSLQREPELARRMGQAGRRRAERGFSRERMIEDYTRMYETVAGRLTDAFASGAGVRTETRVLN